MIYRAGCNLQGLGQVVGQIDVVDGIGSAIGDVDGQNSCVVVATQIEVGFVKALAYLGQAACTVFRSGGIDESWPNLIFVVGPSKSAWRIIERCDINNGKDTCSITCVGLDRWYQKPINTVGWRCACSWKASRRRTCR
ncbi:hypothetical protein D3C71_1603300 [compost metagenome]